jgi:putative tricarboxylic transport membrane protein
MTEEFGMRANDALSGALLILLAAAMIGYTTTFPAFRGQDYGPALFPRILGAGLILCGAILVRRGIAARRAGEGWVLWAEWTRNPAQAASFLLVLGSILLYILASEQVGFLPIAALILAALFLWFGVRWMAALPIALVATWTIHWFFASAMRVPLPRGWLNEIL